MMGVQKCFLCGDSPPIQINTSMPHSGRRKLDNWSLSWAASLCSILKLDETYERLFARALFCSTCQQTVCSAEFTVSTLRRLESELAVIREEIKTLLLNNYGDEKVIQRRGRDLGVFDAETQLIQNMMTRIQLKEKPREDSYETDERDAEFILPTVIIPSSQRLVKLKNRNQDHLTSTTIHVNPPTASYPTRIQKTKVSRLQYEAPVGSRVRRKTKPTFLSDAVEEDAGENADEETGESLDSSYADEDDARDDIESEEIKKVKPDGNVKYPRRRGDSIPIPIGNLPKVKLTCNELECSELKLTFGTLQLVRIHMEKEHGRSDMKSLYHCSQCPLRFTRPGRLQAHTYLKHTTNGAIAGQSGSPVEKPLLKLTCNMDSCQGKDLTFESTREVRQHIREVHQGRGLKNDNVYHCGKCSMRTYRPFRLHRHLRIKHGMDVRTFYYPNTKTIFLSASALEKHIGKIHGSVTTATELECSVCQKSFFVEEELRQHEQLHLGSNPFFCVICKKNWSDGRSLRQHVKSEHDWKKYPCNFPPCLQINAAFLTQRLLSAHLKEEHGLGGGDLKLVFHCTKCELRFSCRSSLGVHERKIHQGTPSHLCTICGRVFFRDKHLSRHVEEFHTTLRTNPKCRFCAKSTETEEALREHEGLHSSETPFDCVLCETRHMTTFDLQTHVYATHEVLPFKCPREGCGRSYDTKAKHDQHMRFKHSKFAQLKPHQCPHCPYAARSPSRLKEHLLSHTRIAEFRCPFEGCGRKYIYKRTFNIHLRQEHNPLGPISYDCKICGKGFKKPHRLREHEIHHGDARPFPCNLCSATFKSSSNLRGHKRVHAKRSGTNMKPHRPRKARLAVILRTSEGAREENLGQRRAEIEIPNDSKNLR